MLLTTASKEYIANIICDTIPDTHDGTQTPSFHTLEVKKVQCTCSQVQHILTHSCHMRHLVNKNVIIFFHVYYCVNILTDNLELAILGSDPY